MKYGFSGTRHGMSHDQARELIRFLEANGDSLDEVHHGDCIGADAQFHELVRRMFKDKVKIVAHPPNLRKYRAHMEADEARTPVDYLTRDKAIVDECEVILVAPKEMQVTGRSGTWYTARYAMRSHFTVFFLPNGQVMANDRFTHTFDGRAKDPPPATNEYRRWVEG